MRWLWCVLVVSLVIGCGDDDAGGPADAGIDASQPVVDAGPALPDAAPEPDAGTSAGITGRVTYDRRPFGRSGLGAASPAPAPGLVVVLLEGDVELAFADTDAEGRFAFDRDDTGGLSVRVLAATSEPEIAITDLEGATYAFRAAVTSGAADLHVAEPDFAGALAIADTMRAGLVRAKAAFARDAAFPPLETRWERGRSTPGGTSYASGDTLWILGGPDDTDEYDEPVLLHELGHFLQFVHDFSDVVAGDPHDGSSTDPRLAWNEGWPSFFAAFARGDSFYGDTVSGEISLALDLASLPRSGDFVASPSAPMSQPLSEWIIASSLWRLYVASPDEGQQSARSFGVLTGWLADRSRDRAAAGPELVDFLDGYLCTHAGADRGVVESYVVADRGFPYDLAPPCEKPGRPRLLRSIQPAPVPLPGRTLVDARGRQLREITIR